MRACTFPNLVQNDQKIIVKMHLFCGDYIPPKESLKNVQLRRHYCSDDRPCKDLPIGRWQLRVFVPQLHSLHLPFLILRVWPFFAAKKPGYVGYFHLIWRLAFYALFWITAMWKRCISDQWFFGTMYPTDQWFFGAMYPTDKWIKCSVFMLWTYRKNRR